MKGKPATMIALLILLSSAAQSQDTLFMTGQRQQVVKVMEIDQASVKYKKLDNLEGPLYSLPKNEIIRIHYGNGSKDEFSAAENSAGNLKKGDLLQLLKKPGAKAFVQSFDEASIIHAKNALQNSTPWALVDDKNNAQFIIRFAYNSIGFGDKKGKAQFLDPKTEAVIFETGSVNTTMSWDMNTKRGVIDKVVHKEIRKLLK